MSRGIHRDKKIHTQSADDLLSNRRNAYPASNKERVSAE